MKEGVGSQGRADREPLDRLAIVCGALRLRVDEIIIVCKIRGDRHAGTIGDEHKAELIAGFEASRGREHAPGFCLAKRSEPNPKHQCHR